MGYGVGCRQRDAEPGGVTEQLQRVQLRQVLVKQVILYQVTGVAAVQQEREVLRKFESVPFVDERLQLVGVGGRIADAESEDGIRGQQFRVRESRRQQQAGRDQQAAAPDLCAQIHVNTSRFRPAIRRSGYGSGL